MSRDLAVWTAPKAVDRRREILPEVRSSLGAKDLAIFEASTHRLISEMDEAELVHKCKTLFKGVAIDVGYSIPDADTWAYLQTRLMDLLRRYYGHLSLAEVRLAFELATMGELNNYLPKDANGNPDNKHYGQFNASFFGKILTAYQKRQQVAMAAAERSIPKPDYWTAEKEAQARVEMRQRCKDIYTKYCNEGELDLGLAGGVIVYDWLQRIGRVGKLEETDDDRQRAMELFMRNLTTRRTSNVYEALAVQEQGAKSKVLDYDSQKIAERRLIKEAFNKMCAEGVNIEELL